MFQQIDYQCRTLAYIIPRGPLPDATTFVTPSECTQQVGYVCHKAGQSVPRHLHTPIERLIVGTTEVLLVMKGRVEVDFYDNDKTWVGARILEEGDLIVIVSGGHGFRMLEDAVMLEVKQGPYPGVVSEKERF